MLTESPEMSKDAPILGKEPENATSGKKAKSTPKEAQRTGRIRTKNRRKIYLDRHPSYFDAPNLELAGLGLFSPVLRHSVGTEGRQILYSMTDA